LHKRAKYSQKSGKAKFEIKKGNKNERKYKRNKKELSLGRTSVRWYGKRK
jgi:hypothetical protein